jgi:hypothetical protein
MDWIVLLSAGFAAAFTAAWLLSPRLRAWIERPKFRFQENLARLERIRGAQKP